MLAAEEGTSVSPELNHPVRVGGRNDGMVTRTNPETGVRKKSGAMGEPSAGAVRLEDVRDGNAGQRQQGTALADEVEVVVTLSR